MPDPITEDEAYVKTFLARLVELAEAASLSTDSTIGRPDQAPFWEPYFTVHGDPSVTELGRGKFGNVAKILASPDVAAISTSPGDYGRARASYIGALDPALVLALVPIIARVAEADAEVAIALAFTLRQYTAQRQLGTSA